MSKLSLSLVLLVAAIFPASSVAAPPEGAEAEIVISTVAFPKTTAGTESAAQQVDVSNDGDAGTWVEKTMIEGPDSGSFKVVNTDCNQLEPSGHCSLWIAFMPGEAGEREASLNLHMGDGSDASTPLVASAVPAQLAFTPGSHDFGLAQINQGNSSAGFQLTNTGEAAAQVGGIGIGGEYEYFWTSGQDCQPPGGRWLQPGESCFVEAHFNPRDTRAYSGQVQAYAYGQTFSAPLSGEGGRPVVEAAVNPFEFGAAPVGSVGEPQAVEFTNSGNLPGGFFIAIVAGGDVGSFQLLDESCTEEPLAPGASCVAHIRFAPQRLGPLTARLALFGEGEGGTMVKLRGEGLAALPLAPASATTSSSGTATTSGSGPAAGAADPQAQPPRRRGRHRRFARGATIGTGVAARPHRPAVRVSSAPR
jgi:hypothetical protein